MTQKCFSNPPEGLFAIAAAHWPQSVFYLAVENPSEVKFPEELLKEIFDGLSEDKKREAYYYFYELDVRDIHPSLPRDTWGEEHFWDEIGKARRVMHRLGLLGNEGIVPICYNREIEREVFNRVVSSEDIDQEPWKMPISWYYSLGEKVGKEPPGKRISYVNGMGTRPELAGTDTNYVSNYFAQGYNIHAVYLPTQQRVFGDPEGLLCDSVRMAMVSQGALTRTACLIAQQWIDFLGESEKNTFLQFCFSEGAAHVDAALNLMREIKPELLDRITIIALCPAKFIVPCPHEKGTPTVINIYKVEDFVCGFSWNLHTLNQTEASKYMRIVPHQDLSKSPHAFNCSDYEKAVRPYVERFLNTEKENRIFFSMHSQTPFLERRFSVGMPSLFPRQGRQFFRNLQDSAESPTEELGASFKVGAFGALTGHVAEAGFRRLSSSSTRVENYAQWARGGIQRAVGIGLLMAAYHYVKGVHTPRL